MLNWCKYPWINNPRVTIKELEAAYPSASRGEKVAITKKIKQKKGFFTKDSPQLRRQRILQWTLMNAKNSEGMLHRARYQLAAISREVSDAEKVKLLDITHRMGKAANELKNLVEFSRTMFPPKAKKKEKENA